MSATSTASALFALVLVLALGALPRGDALTIEEIRAYCATLPNSTLVIGMITKGNAELTLNRWRPTFDTYLTNSMAQYGCKTKMVPLEFDSYTNATRDSTIDFLFPNPTAFQEMKQLYDVHEFLSVKRNFGVNQQLDRFGGVIVRATTGRMSGVTTLSDLNKFTNITVCGVNANAFGGWQIQLYQLILQGVELERIVPVFTGGHEKAMNATIVDKTCDLGVSRTETLERQVSLGEFKESDFYTIDERGPALGFPQHLTTVLYPEWPLASLKHVPRDIEQIIAVPLLTMSANSSEAKAGDFAGFTFPYSYEPVRKMFIGIDKDKDGKCDPGYKRVGSNPGLCVACPAGFFSEDGVPKVCEACPLGTVNNGTANAKCTFCPEGLTTLKTASKVGSCVPPIKVRQDDKTVTTSIGAAAAVLILGAILCYVVYRNSAGVWDVFITIVSDFFLTMVSFGFEIVDILTDWFAYMQLVELKYSSSHPNLFATYTVMMGVSTVVSFVNVVVRLVVAYKMSQEATALAQVTKTRRASLASQQLGAGGSNSSSRKRMSMDSEVSTLGGPSGSLGLASGGSVHQLTVNARMNLADMAQLGTMDNVDVTEAMLYNMNMEELRGNGITVKRLLLTRQMSLAVAVLEDIPMIILNAIVLNENPNNVIMIATFFSCILLGNKMYPIKQTFKLRHMDYLIRDVLFKRNMDAAILSGVGSGDAGGGGLDAHPIDKSGALKTTAATMGAVGAGAGGVILMM